MDELDPVRDGLLEGRIGRDAFLRRIAARNLDSGAAARLSAWGRGGVGVAHAAVDATPRRGGVLKFARNFEPVTLGPFGAADNGTIWTGSPTVYVRAASVMQARARG
jgi:hypothetical protein